MKKNNDTQNEIRSLNDLKARRNMIKTEIDAQKYVLYRTSNVVESSATNGFKIAKGFATLLGTVKMGMAAYHLYKKFGKVFRYFRNKR